MEAAPASFEGDVPVWDSSSGRFDDGSDAPPWPERVVIGSFGRHDHGPGFGKWVLAAGDFDFATGWTEHGCFLCCWLPRPLAPRAGQSLELHSDAASLTGSPSVTCNAGAGAFPYRDVVTSVEIRLPPQSKLSMASASGAELGGLPNIVVLLTGQSNSLGAGGKQEPWHPDDQPVEGVLGWDCLTGRWRPARLDDWSLGLKPPGLQCAGFHFARYLKRRYPGARVGVVVVGEGGQSIRRWNRKLGPADIYDASAAHVRAALADSWTGSVCGILWSQGQGDADLDVGMYRACLRGVIDQYRGEPFCSPRTPFVSCELPGKRYASGHADRQTEAHRDLDRDADSKTAAVFSANLETSDPFHFTTESHRELGRRYFMAWAWMLRGGKRPRLWW